MNLEKKERDIAIDIVKFFAVLLIINSHADTIIRDGFQGFALQ